MRYLSLFLVMCLCFCCFVAVPVLAAEVSESTTEAVGSTDPVSSVADDSVLLDAVGPEFDGLVSFQVSSALGEITLYLPNGSSRDDLQLADGYLYNTTGSTLYLYCPQYPDYTFSASRFDTVYYRVNATGYSSVELAVTAVNSSVPDFENVLPFLILFAMFLSGFSLLWRS